MNSKQSPSTNYIAVAIVILWLYQRSVVAKLSPIASAAIDVILLWLCAPMILHILAVLLLVKGIDASAATKKFCFTLGLNLEKLAVGIDSINQFIPFNIFYVGADDRKVILGGFLQGLEKRQEAKEYLSAVYKELKAGGKNQSQKSLSNCLNFLSEIAHHEGNYKEAKRFAEECVEVIERSEDDPIGRCAAFTDLCATYIKQGQFKESINIGKKAVAAIENFEPPAYQIHAIAYNNLGLAYSYAGNYDESLNCGLKALELKKKAHPTENLSWAVTLSNIAETQCFQEKFEEAENTAREALAIIDRLGYRNPEPRATILQNLGSAQLGLGNFAEAKTNLTESFNVKSKNMTAKDPEWVLFYLDLARMHAGLNEKSQADNYFSKSIERGKQTLGENHPRMAYIYAEHARYLEANDRQQEAKEARRLSKEISDKWSAY